MLLGGILEIREDFRLATGFRGFPRRIQTRNIRIEQMEEKLLTQIQPQQPHTLLETFIPSGANFCAR